MARIEWSIKTNFPEVQRKLSQLQDEVGKQALASALNKTVAQAKTGMSREIRAEFVISAALVNQSLLISRASAKGGEFRMQASLSSISQRGKRSLNLIHFAARRTSKGVSFRIKKVGGRKTIPGAFIGNAGRTVFIRTGKKRLPIKALQTINIAQMFNTKRINSKVLELIDAKFPQIFDNEARFFTNRFNQRG